MLRCPICKNASVKYRSAEITEHPTQMQKRVYYCPPCTSIFETHETVATMIRTGSAATGKQHDLPPRPRKRGDLLDIISYMRVGDFMLLDAVDAVSFRHSAMKLWGAGSYSTRKIDNEYRCIRRS